MKTYRNRMICVTVMAMLGGMFAGELLAQSAQVPPDLTQSNEVDRKLTYNLGSTGLRGWIYTKPAAYLDSVQGRTTAASRQILVTHVGAKSPADGVMQVDDIILGVGGKLFSDDARKSIARGIQESEKDANRGILKLTRWRSGETEEVQLKLNVMGTYSDTAPYDCPKSKRIFEEACAALEKERLELNLWGAINGLALMSTGNPDYLPKVREFARKLGASTLRPRRQSMGTWEIGYQNIFLCESITSSPTTKRCCPLSVTIRLRWPVDRACTALSDTAFPS